MHVSAFIIHRYSTQRAVETHTSHVMIALKLNPDPFALSQKTLPTSIAFHTTSSSLYTFKPQGFLCFCQNFFPALHPLDMLVPWTKITLHVFSHGCLPSSHSSHLKCMSLRWGLPWCLSEDFPISLLSANKDLRFLLFCFYRPLDDKLHNFLISL